MDTLMLFEKIAGQSTGSLTEKLAADIVAMVYEKLASIKTMAPEFAIEMAKRLAKVQQQSGKAVSSGSAWVEHLLNRQALGKTLSGKMPVGTTTTAPRAAGAGTAIRQSEQGSLKLKPVLPESTPDVEAKVRQFKAQRMAPRIQQGNRY